MDGLAGGEKKEERLSQSEETSCRVSFGCPNTKFFCPLTMPLRPAQMDHTILAVCGALQRLNQERIQI